MRIGSMRIGWIALSIFPYIQTPIVLTDSENLNAVNLSGKLPMYHQSLWIWSNKCSLVKVLAKFIGKERSSWANNCTSNEGYCSLGSVSVYHIRRTKVKCKLIKSCPVVRYRWKFSKKWINRASYSYSNKIGGIQPFGWLGNSACFFKPPGAFFWYRRRHSSCIDRVPYFH